MKSESPSPNPIQIILLIFFLISGFMLALWTILETAHAATEDNNSKQLVALYGQVYHQQQAKDFKEYMINHPKAYLYWYGAQQGVSYQNLQHLETIAQCESQWDPVARNKHSSAKGLFQFLDSTWTAYGEGSVFNPINNIQATIKLFKLRGFSPWECNQLI